MNSAKDRISFQEIDTDNLILRRFTLEDASLFKGVADLRVSFENVISDYATHRVSLLALHLRSSREFVGSAGLIPLIIDGDLIWEFRCSLLPKFQSKGFAQELGEHFKLFAYSQLGAKFLYGFVQAENQRAVRVAERLGMKYFEDREIDGHLCRVYRIEL